MLSHCFHSFMFPGHDAFIKCSVLSFSPFFCFLFNISAFSEIFQNKSLSYLRSKVTQRKEFELRTLNLHPGCGISYQLWFLWSPGLNVGGSPRSDNCIKEEENANIHKHNRMCSRGHHWFPPPPNKERGILQLPLTLNPHLFKPDFQVDCLYFCLFYYEFLFSLGGDIWGILEETAFNTAYFVSCISHIA